MVVRRLGGYSYLAWPALSCAVIARGKPNPDNVLLISRAAATCSAFCFAIGVRKDGREDVDDRALKNPSTARRGPAAGGGTENTRTAVAVSTTGLLRVL